MFLDMRGFFFSQQIKTKIVKKLHVGSSDIRGLTFRNQKKRKRRAWFFTPAAFSGASWDPKGEDLVWANIQVNIKPQISVSFINL